MGAETFQNYASGANAEEAFQAVHDEAAYESGHGGYTGTIAEKGSFVIITKTPLLESEAEALAGQLIEDSDERIDDKWGPAGAIPVLKGTRDVQVSGFSYLHDHDFKGGWQEVQPALLEAVKPLVKLKRGETIQSVRLTSYNTPDRTYRSYDYSRSKTTYSNCSATVTINKPPTTRTITATFEIPGGLEWGAKYKEVETLVQAVKLRQGERVIAHKITKDEPGNPKVTAVAPKAKTATRYVIKGSRAHATWENGFPSQAEARAWATYALHNADNQFHDDVTVFEIEGVTRRASGEALVRVAREVTKRTVEVEIEVKLANVDTATTPDGWLFFGWASS